jgi:hypothetical protein
MEYVGGFIAHDEELALDAGDRSPRIGGSIGGKGKGRVVGDRKNPDRADAICAIAEKQAKIVIFGDMRDPRLPFAQPSFRTEMLKKRVQPLPPIMLTPGRGKTAANGLPPRFVVYKSCAAGGRFFQATRDLILKGYMGDAKHIGHLQFIHS